MSIDFSYFNNPILLYIKWLKCKLFYQYKNRKKKLRIGYNSIVKNTNFGLFNWIGKDVSIANSSFGDYSYVNDNSSISNSYIGSFCSIGPGVRISPGKHPTSIYVSTHPSTYYNPDNLLGNFDITPTYIYTSEVKIGNDVWIGANAIIIDGVTIGDGAIIAANSVVTRDVEPYSIVAGIPAKHQRFRFSDIEIQFLCELQWWNKDRDWLKQNVQYFSSLELLKSKEAVYGK